MLIPAFLNTRPFGLAGNRKNLTPVTLGRKTGVYQTSTYYPLG